MSIALIRVALDPGLLGQEARTLSGGELQIANPRQVEIPVQLYLVDALPGSALEQALLEVLLTSGVEDVRETPVVISSWYRSLTGLLKRAADSEAAAEARRAVELQVLDRFQAGVDGVTSDAVAKLITALDQTRGAVIQVGSVLLIKAEGRSSSGNSPPAR